MINITKNGNVSVILFTDSDYYLFNSGQIIAPLGSLTMVVDSSDMVTFRKAANNDLLFSAKLGKITINGTLLTKQNAQSLFDEALGGGGSGGGSGIRFVEVQQLPQTGENDIIYLVPNGDDTFTEYVWLEDEERFEKLGYDVDLSNYYTKEEIDDAHLTISAALNELHDEKQDLLNFDNSPTQNSTNPVTSGGVYNALQNVQPDLSDYYTKTQVDTALANKQNTLTFDSAPTQNSTNPVTSGGVYTALSGKQDTLTFDSAPTQNSTNPVTSGGVYNALQNVQPDLSNYYNKTEVDTALANKQNTLTFDSAPTQNSTNPVTSGGVYDALQNVQPDLSNYYDKDEIDEGNRVVSTALNRLNSEVGDIDTALATIIGSNS